MALRFVWIILLALIVLDTPSVAVADPTRCREAVGKASAKHLQARMKALAKCEDAVVKGSLPAATDCTTEASVVTALTNATTKLHQQIDAACGGDDRTCGTGADDDSLASIGWATGSCPDLEGLGCNSPTTHCGEMADCLACVNGAATDQLRGLYFDALAAAPAADVEKCQRVIGKAATKFVRTKSKTLQKCWNSVSKGGATAPCPDPGDGKATLKIARAEEKLIASICKACGGDDRGCDQAIGAVTGTGGSDDFSVAQIGFAATCTDVTIPGAASSCAAPIASLADVVRCVDCVSEFKVDCADALTVPWGMSYPAECNASSAPSATPTATPTATGTITPEPCEALVYSEDFDGTDGSPWPAQWSILGGTDVADLQGNRARFRPTVTYYSLSRLFHPLTERDVEVEFTAEFGDVATQGIGFYMRQNGGYLAPTMPGGQGYNVFIEGFRATPGLGLWKELNGVEIPLVINFNAAFNFQNGVRYRVKFRVHQSSPTTTMLRAKIWAEAGSEPAVWQVEFEDNTPVLQNISGGIAFDSYTSINPDTPGDPPPQDAFVDDVQVTRLCNPLYGIGAVNSVQESFVFTEGPLWRSGTLLFTDVDTSTIHELTPPSTVAVFRSPSDEANGLATDVNGDLLAAEHLTRRVSRTDSMGAISTVADTYMGLRFNSPNDIAVRSDGTIYFSDPAYGLADPMDRELPFNGLFRRTPAGALSVEWMGSTSSGPNGVSLSPDESVLYMAETSGGNVLAWDVAPDGSLSNLRLFADGLFIPDGTCIDTRGNVYVATWANNVEVYSPQGDRWGVIAIPRQATNCGFGGADALTLYVTAHEGLYSVPMVVPGIP